MRTLRWLGGLLVAFAVVAGPVPGTAGTTRAVVANSGDPGSVTIIDLSDGSTVTLTDPSFAAPRWVAITPNGKFAGVTNAGSDTVTWIDLTSDTVLGTTVVGPGPRGIALTAAQAVVALDDADDTVKVIDIAGLPVLPSVVVTPGGPGLERGDDPEGVRITPGGRYALVALNGAQGVRYVDLGAVPMAFLPGSTATAQGPFDVAVADGGARALVTLSRGDSVAVVDISGLPAVPAGPLTEIDVGERPRGIAVSADDRLAVVATRHAQGRVAIVDLANQGVTFVPTFGGPFGVAVTTTPGGPVGVVTRENSDPGMARAIDLVAKAKLFDVAVGDGPLGVAITPIRGPRARLAVTPARGTVPLAVVLDASASRDPDGGLRRFTYAFGDGTPRVTKVCANDPTCATASHTYTTEGRHRASVEVTDDDGATGKASKIVAAVANEPPNVKIEGRRVGPAPLTIRFEARASDEDGTIVSYCWNFDDGTPGCHATGPRPRRVFEVPGRYRITLTVTDDAGATATAEHKIQVQAPE